MKRKREGDGERFIAGGSRPREDTKKLREARAVLTIAMYNIFYARIHLCDKKKKKTLHLFSNFKRFLKIPLQNIYFYKNLNTLICMEY